MRFLCEGKTVVYSGDTEWTDNLIRAAKDADLFIAECLSFERPVKFHMNFQALTMNAPRIGARRMLITHMGPDMLNREIDGVERAHDGLVVEV